METKASNMEEHVDRPNGYLVNYQTGPAYSPTPTRFDLDAAWQRLLQLPLGLLGILAISLLLLAISLPQTTNATNFGPAVTATPTVTPSPTVASEAAGLNAPAATHLHSSSSLSSVPSAGGDSVAGRNGGPNMALLALQPNGPSRASHPAQPPYR